MDHESERWLAAALGGVDPTRRARLRDEILDHLAEATAAHMARGATADEARAAALADLGDPRPLLRQSSTAGSPCGRESPVPQTRPDCAARSRRTVRRVITRMVTMVSGMANSSIAALKTRSPGAAVAAMIR